MSEKLHNDNNESIQNSDDLSELTETIIDTALNNEEQAEVSTNDEAENAEKDSNVIQFPYKRKQISRKSKINYTLILTIAGIIILFIAWGLVHKNAQEVYVNDIKIGAIQDMDIKEDELFTTAVAKLKSELGVNIEVEDKITLRPVHASRKEILSVDNVLADICKNFSFKLEASVITVDGIEMAILPNAESAQKILDEITSKYVKEENKNVIERSFVQDVKIDSKYVEGNKVIESEKAFDILSSSSSEERKYKVKEGDTLWGIANSAEMSMAELLKANPSITEETILKLGQELTTVVPVPVLSVKTVEQNTYEAVEPKKVETVENNNEYKTYKKVLQEGKDGKKQVTENITKINGMETEKKVVSEKITLEPVTEKIEVGTLQTPPKRALGNFIYPVLGRLSSNYGPRWGTSHKGIDLAAPKNTPVSASDGGTVIYAGWNSGGYGNLVQIDHGNGFVTYYGHNSTVSVKVGQKVAQGEVIAYVGSTGDSTGNHVHFEIRKNGVIINPFDYLG